MAEPEAIQELRVRTQWLVEASPDGRWVVGAPTATALVAEIDRLQAATRQPCGSNRVIRTVEGLDAEIVWCSRTHGPCPWPNTRATRDGNNHGRRCAVEEAPDAG